MKFFRSIIDVAFWGFLLVGCQQPEPEVVELRFDNLEATAGAGSVTLAAELLSDVTAVSECGFFVGTSEDAMKRYLATFENGCFSKTLTGLEYETEYIWMAFVGNGRNVMRSETQTFVTLSAPPDDKPDDGSDKGSGDGSDDGSNEDSGDGSDDKKDGGNGDDSGDEKEEIIYEMSLSSMVKNVSCYGENFSVTVYGNADFEVIVPENVKWIEYEVVGRECRFKIGENLLAETRACDVVFNSLSHEFSCTYQITQPPRFTKHFGTIELPHSAMSGWLYMVNQPNGFTIWTDGCDWINLSGWDEEYGGFTVNENLSMKSRECLISYGTDSGEYAAHILQHSYIEYIDFKDPQTKSLCVGLWDTNGDGEVSFDEAVSVRDITKECFAGKDFALFDEFRFFVNVCPWNSMPDYLFEGSNVETVSLPYGLYEHTSTGMFKDCKNLKQIDVGCRAIATETFMGCTALKEIDAIIEGERAFMGCTALEKVVQKCGCVPEMAFKGCTSLASFEFSRPDLFKHSPASIGKGAFCGCTSLSEIDLHFYLDEICEAAFSGCTSLKEIRIKRNVKTIGDRTFYGCAALNSVYLSSSTPPTLGAEVFSGTASDLKFYVPAVLVNVYKNQWPDLADRIEPCDWVE